MSAKSEAPQSLFHEEAVAQFVIHLQTEQLPVLDQLGLLGKLRAIGPQRFEPGAVDYLDRQIEALKHFVG